MMINQSYLNVLMSWRLWRKMDSLGEEHPVNKALDAAFAREYSAIRELYQDQGKAWGSVSN